MCWPTTTTWRHLLEYAKSFLSSKALSGSVVLAGDVRGSGMPKKKQPYVLFCQERQQMDPSLRSKSLAELVDLCSGTWRELAPGEKQKYIRMAKIYNDKRYLAGGGGDFVSSADIDLAGKFNSSGQSLLAKQRKRVRAESKYAFSL